MQDVCVTLRPHGDPGTVSEAPRPVPREQAAALSPAAFVERYLAPNVPVLIEVYPWYPCGPGHGATHAHARSAQTATACRG